MNIKKVFESLSTCQWNNTPIFPSLTLSLNVKSTDLFYLISLHQYTYTSRIEILWLRYARLISVGSV